MFFFFKQKTAYEMRISDWSSDVCSSDLRFELVMVPFAMATLYSPKHPEVERINPKRQVPVLVHRSNGGPDLELFDSTQIFEYLEDLAPDPALWPREAAARARARQPELLSDEVYFPPIIRLMGLRSEKRRVGKEWVGPCRSGWS